MGLIRIDLDDAQTAAAVALACTEVANTPSTPADVRGRLLDVVRVLIAAPDVHALIGDALFMWSNLWSGTLDLTRDGRHVLANGVVVDRTADSVSITFPPGVGGGGGSGRQVASR